MSETHWQTQATYVVQPTKQAITLLQCKVASLIKLSCQHQTKRLINVINQVYSGKHHVQSVSTFIQTPNGIS